MIIKGKGRTQGSELGPYLGDYLKAPKNEKVSVLEIRGSAFPDLTRSINSWEAEAQRGRCKKPLWHAQIAPAPEDRKLTREQMLECVDILERHYGFQGQPRAVVMHQKKDGTEHVHVVWSRIDRETGKARRDSFTHKKNVAASREIEDRFDLRKVKSPDFDTSAPRAERREQAKKAPTYKDYQKAKRSGIDPRKRKEVITGLWHTCDTGTALRAGLQDAGYILAYGDRRSYVVVDMAGDVHSLARQIQDANTDAVRQRLKDIDPASIPKVRHVKQQLRHAFEEHQGAMPRPKAAPQDAMDSTTQSASGDQSHSGATVSRKGPPPETKSASLDPGEILAAMTARQSTFTQYDLQYEIGRRLDERKEERSDERVKCVEKAVQDHEDFISLGADRTERPRFTSRQMLETELAMRDASDNLVARWGHGVGEKVKYAAPSLERLGKDQLQAYEHVMRAEGLVNIIGYAGSGKSTLLKSANEGWTAQGYRVRGTAVAGIAAEGLQKGSGIQSRTLASTLFMLDHVAEHQAKLAAMDEQLAGITGRGEKARKYRCDMQTKRDKLAARVDGMKLGPRDIIVVDEAGMVGSRDMKRLLDHADKAKAKVVLVGDAEQLQAIDAGGAFRALTDRHGAVKISEIRRQEQDWQKQATKDFGDGFTSEALDAYKQRGHIREFNEHADARRQVIQDWTASRKANADESHLMLAFTNADVDSLNQEARDIYRSEGRLGTDAHIETAKGRKSFARADRFYFLESNTGLGVKNGSLGTVEKIERHLTNKHHRMTVRLDDGRQVQFSTSDYSKFDHGYAATMHRSQGATAVRAHVLASPYMDRHAAYVAMTRQVKQADMYYGRDQFRDYGDLVRLLGRDRRKDTTLDYLRRAERQGDRETWLQKLVRAVKAKPQETAPEPPKRPGATLFERIRMEENKTPEQRRADREARQAEKLRDILERSGKNRSTGYTW